MTKLKATRDAYGQALLDLAAQQNDLVVLDADLSRSTRTDWFQKKYPQRFFNIGIAEQNLVGIATGLALTGLLPFATTYAIFIGRAFDQIRQAVGFQRANVKIVATHAGLAASHDGGSHQGTEDVALMRAIPGMTILSPCDYNSAYQAVFAAAKHQGPLYLRLQKEPTPVITGKEEFEIGRCYLLRGGSDVALVAHGTLVAEALQAAERLERAGLSAAVVDARTIKPLDTETLLHATRHVQRIVTIEEHNITGGLRDAVAAALRLNPPVRVEGIGLEDTFGESGNWAELRAKFGLDASGIASYVLQRFGIPLQKAASVLNRS